MEKLIQLMQNQLNVLTIHGESLERHSLAIFQLVKDQHKLEQKVETDIARLTKKLKMMEDRIEELSQGHNPGSDGGIGNRSNGENSSSRQNPKVQQSPSSAKAKNEEVECDYCRKAVKRSYIRQHMRLYCRVHRQQQLESQ